MIRGATMTLLHVLPDERGNWSLVEDGAEHPVSEHPSATQAERAAWVLAEERGADEILVHDRYHRCRRAIRNPAQRALSHR